MTKNTVLNTLRILLAAAALTLTATGPARAGEIQIGPAPCNTATQECAAPAEPGTTTASTGDQASETRAAQALLETLLNFLLGVIS